MWIYQEQIMPEKSNLILQQISASVDREVVIEYLQEGFNIFLKKIFLSNPGQVIQRKLLQNSNIYP